MYDSRKTPAESRSNSLISRVKRLGKKGQLALEVDEHFLLIERLSTRERMRPIWRNLTRRFKKEGEAWSLIFLCDWGMASWRVIPQKTKAQRKAHFLKIAKQASALREMLFEVTEFDHFSSGILMTQDALKDMLKRLDSPIEKKNKNWESRARGIFEANHVHSIENLLFELAEKAELLANDAGSLGQPQAANAESLYFMRGLCYYFNKAYGRPLYEAVAAITEVALDLPYVDPESVRKAWKADPGRKFPFMK